MNTVGTIIAALSGTGAIAALVAALTTYLKSKTAAEDRKKETAAAHKKMAEDMLALRESLTAMTDTMRAAVSEAATLRAEGAAKDKKIAKLTKERDDARAALDALARREVH
ncbi:MAG: hypothetical protein FWF69_00165 [Firmicutes bacterium]|nr:hypothetical protein [Bacillota bacterium]